VLDAVLPRYDLREFHEIVVAADPDDAIVAGLNVRAASDPIVAALLRLRGIPGGDLPLREFLGQLGFTRTFIADRSMTATWDVAGVRIAFALWSEPVPGGKARLATETRVLALDPGTRIRFGIYWLVVGPFSGLIRRRWLAAAKRLAERRA
jgi:hypothetical protein